jgi:Domain of unknown function (DUF4124)
VGRIDAPAFRIRIAMRLALTLALAAGAALAGAAHAVEVYKWKDSKGVVHYGDRPASGVAASVVNARDDEVDPDDAERARQRLSGSQEPLDEYPQEDEPPPSRMKHRASPRTPAPSGCAAAWQRYDAAQACFDRHRVAGGKGVTTGGTIVCKELPQPNCSR